LSDKTKAPIGRKTKENQTEISWLAPLAELHHRQPEYDFRNGQVAEMLLAKYNDI
jgi:hypothetical protein